MQANKEDPQDSGGTGEKLASISVAGEREEYDFPTSPAKKDRFDSAQTFRGPRSSTKTIHPNELLSTQM
jgi:hypothetical protein